MHTRVRGRRWEFKDSLGSMADCLKNKTKTKKCILKMKGPMS
jgi:hypothetical protein